MRSGPRKTTTGLVVVAAVVATTFLPASASAAFESNGASTVSSWGGSPSVTPNAYDVFIGRTKLTDVIEQSTPVPFVGTAEIDHLRGIVYCDELRANCGGIVIVDDAPFAGTDIEGKKMTGTCGALLDPQTAYRYRITPLIRMTRDVSGQNLNVAAQYTIEDLACQTTYKGKSQFFMIDETFLTPAPKNLLAPPQMTGVYCSGLTGWLTETAATPALD